METIGIRALKQNASAVIARVEAGESFEVTNRGRVVGTIVPSGRIAIRSSWMRE